MKVDQAVMQDRVRGALWGLLIADALSMPVHWYYNPNDIVRDYQYIEDYQPPRVRHPSSIMNLSNTGGHGRGGQEGRVIGDVINHGKHQFWGKPGMHYHQGMKAGENTLNALCARVVMRSIAQRGGYDPAGFLQDYVQFMTTPGSHNDTYAESFHRDFFGNWAKGVPAERCAKGTEGHNTAQIGGFVMLAPVVMEAALRGESAEGAAKAALTHLSLTHDSRKLAGFAQTYAKLMYNVSAGGQDLREAVGAVAKDMDLGLDKLVGGQAGTYDDLRVVHGVFGSACYIEDSFPVTLYLAYKYADSFEKAVLTNTNVGGENCHRGAALGALMGAGLGESRIPEKFIKGLHDYPAIKQEIDAVCATLFKSQ
eukprot:CAMPEP_0202866534 /NCGR_PEP_ID=MMETSP1391-20130828/7852_1 /ASSEMBLY_ACC=CAM_ASM_000867 /TAXON_ID=1034604 /ORGANISM="Chlamydomonas leiostraca, Strain SAG 11-49" /LENGTH=366 /DNA_ID=CAMNT_0049546491 /DNA_START=218 /DNA_END=1318 /DNA_ORIENTATION=+